MQVPIYGAMYPGGRTSTSLACLMNINTASSGGYKGVAMISAETPSENKAHAQNQFTEWAQVGEAT